VAAVGAIGRMRPVVAATLSLAVLVALNLALLPFANHYLRNGLLLATIDEGPRAAADRFAPSRAVARYLRESAPIGAGLWVHDGRGAELSGQMRVTGWYDTAMSGRFRAAQEDASGQAWRALIADFRLRTIVVDPASLEPTLAGVLHDLGAVREAVIASYEVWRIPRGAQLPSMQPPRVSPDRIELRFRADRLRSINMVMEFRCDTPGRVIFVRALDVLPDGAREELASTRAICGKEGRGLVQQVLHRDGDAAELLVVAHPQGRMSFELLDHDVHPASAAGAQTDLAATLRDRLARGQEAGR
jgi:hypothetical protein